MTDSEKILLLCLVWLAYFVLHSALASLGLKRLVAERWPALALRYRLLFNLIALLLLLPILGLTLLGAGEPLLVWSGPWRWLAWAIFVMGVMGFIWTARYYDMAAFLGLHPAPPLAEQGFQLSPPHRFVRHPWYFFGLLILWSRDMDALMLTSALLLTLYLEVGSRLEERKLVLGLGAPYERYQSKVSRLIPLPGRFLSQGEAQALMAQARAETKAAINDA
jgi:protein-S-isoprenylcysteine O-methyltransferase Ste14